MAYDVVIVSKEMGKGEESLTQTLMLGFIHTLAEREEKPKNIILYGEGVALTCKGSEAIDDLKALEAAGVNILSCGICLNFLELDKKLEVGGVTTMGEVVDILAASDHIIKP
ncbi:sulfurtransferase-like selenium metabolism protein YedF [Atopobacter sp. AH10]|uniref:sulfurtransferase-like selenium metabolism protein YedF n=1 Tax=Atopobacter sp. AH10 TaxID=2315861 RepID=UPI000EF20B9F|nr:sulfurtransferase-like selenium metabolism protein YedF [Atopobacter sp. AH10]RLK63478.1 sulfurtransferase-like selenium metabolism protein YedF [Atopobacter sp. AH10]